MSPSALVVIPARYGSTRLPGKPMADLGGVSLLHRVCRIATAVRWPDLEVVVATDDERIAAHAEAAGVKAVMTSESCASGTDRAVDALAHLGSDAELVVNLQGDAPFTPPGFVEGILAGLSQAGTDVATPVHRLSWPELDALRATKAKNPFSGTTAIIDDAGFAVWFSKNIIPAIRNEAALRETADVSPVLKHVGLYGYRRHALEALANAAPSRYEVLEGLEQLRFLHLGLRIRLVEVEFGSGLAGLGVDSPDDLARAASLLREHGEPAWMA